jgi:putative zinc finger protein
MNCSDARARFDALLDSRLNDDAASEVRAHAASCDACGRLLDDASALERDVCGSLRAERLPDEAWSRIEPRVRAELRSASASRSRPRLLRWAAAAVAAALLAAVAWIALSGEGSTLAAAAVRDHLTYEKSGDLGPGAARTIADAQRLLESRLGLRTDLPNLGAGCGADLEFVGACAIGGDDAPGVQAFFTCCGRPVSVIFTKEGASTDCRSMECACDRNGLRSCSLVRGALRAFVLARDHDPSDVASKF